MIDLPQHLSQAHLAGKVLSGAQPDKMINWLSPDTLTTWFLACLLIFLPPLAAAKVAVLGLLMLSILGIALLARRIGASPAVVPLSAALLFNQPFYWGFLPFLAGFAAFLFLVIAWLGLARTSWRTLVFLALLFLLVYFSHVLWLAVAMLAVLLIVLVSPDRNVKLRVMFFSALPAVGIALFWYPSMRNNWMNAGFDMSPIWNVPMLGRLHPDYAANMISGLETDFNFFLLFTTLLFILVGIGRAAAKGHRIISAPLLALAAILLAAYLVMPDQYNFTVLFAVRWVSYMFIFFLLGCFAPIHAAKWRVGILIFCFMSLGGYALLTASTWNKMEKEELSGLMQAMEKLPRGQNVLGLDFIKESARINPSTPFANNAAYAQVFKDCEVNSSFAEHASSLVTYKTMPSRQYTKGLSFNSELVTRRDVEFFSYVLVNANETTHGKLAVSLGLTPVTHDGRWRLYAVNGRD